MTTIFTIGHGNRAIGEFVALLREAEIECLVDVRAYPVSRRHPQFAREALAKSLTQAGIRYAWEGKSLGGRRKLAKDSPHIALKSLGFRAYADYMATEEFGTGLDRLLEVERAVRPAIMCAERLPWECHRNLIADSLSVRGVRVLHLMGPGESREHALSPLARKDGERLVYDAGEQLRLGI
jgi:uncharacterized protein (DUF488 family)